MSGSHREVIDRRARLFAILRPPSTAWENCHTLPRLLRALPEDYGGDGASKRMLQRDLQALRDCGDVESMELTPHQFHYRRARSELADDPTILDHERRHLRMRLKDAVQENRFSETLLQELNGPAAEYIHPHVFRVIPDHLQLNEVRLSSEVMDGVLTGLLERQPVAARYTKRSGEVSGGVLHPQALIQRGPLPYLLAVKPTEPSLIKHFPVHRMHRATPLMGHPIIDVEGFDLQAHIDEGGGDFGTGEQVSVKIRVRGYVADILEACPLAADQHIQRAGSETGFNAVVSATVPSTGNLLRWMLAAGANLEVLAPLELRERVAAQANQCCAIYGSNP